MGALEDTRKLLQDIVSPDLKALSARVDALERAMKEGFTAAETLSMARQQKMDLHFELAEKVASARHELLSNRLEQALAAIHAQQETVIAGMNLDRRLERVETMTLRTRAQLPESAASVDSEPEEPLVRSA